MIYKLDDIIKDVRTAIDENSTSEQLSEIEDQDTLSVDQIIRSKIIESMRSVSMVSPLHLLEPTNGASPIIWDANNPYGKIKLSDKFIRLVSFKMSDWRYAISQLITTDSPLYEQQHSSYEGIRGNADRPIGVLVSEPDGKYIEFFSCKSKSATVSKLSYIEIPSIVSNKITYHTLCYNAAILRCASMVAFTLGDKEGGQVLLSMSNEALK